MVVGYIPPTVPVPETVRLLEAARATLPPEQMAKAAPEIIKTVTADPKLQQQLAIIRGSYTPEVYMDVAKKVATALSEKKPAVATAVISAAAPKTVTEAAKLLATKDVAMYQRYIAPPPPPPPPTKTQAQIYEENWQKYPTLAEWAKLWGIPVEQSPFKLGDEARKYQEKHPPTVTVTPTPPTPPAEAPSWLPIAVILGAAYFLTRRK